MWSKFKKKNNQKPKKPIKLTPKLHKHNCIKHSSKILRLWNKSINNFLMPALFPWLYIQRLFLICLPQYYSRRSCFAAYLILSIFWKKMLAGIRPCNLISIPEKSLFWDSSGVLSYNVQGQNFGPSLQTSTANA